MAKILFDSITLHFSPSVFLAQLFHHTFFPLAVPFYVWRYGWTFMFAQGFFYTTFNSFIVGWGSVVSIYMCIFLVYFGSSDIIGEDCLWPVFLFLLHRSMVAFKYATLGPCEYRRMMSGDCGNMRSGMRVKDLSWPSAETIATVRLYQQQLQLNSGWNKMRLDMLHYEMLVAAARTGVHLENSFFVVPNPLRGEHERRQFERWQLFLCKTLAVNCSLTGTSFGKHFSQMPDGSYRVRVHSVAIASMLSACQCDAQSYGLKTCVFFAIINTLIPLVMRFCFAHHEFSPGASRQVIMYYTCTSYLNLVMFVALMSFLYGAVLDVVRRFLLSDVLQHLVRLVDIDLRPKLRMEAVPAGMTEHREAEKKLLRSALKFSQPHTGWSSLQLHSTDKQPFHGVTPDVECNVSKDMNEHLLPSDSDRSAFDDMPRRMYSESLEPFAQPLADLYVPQLDMTIPTNYTAFLQSRKMLHNFGFRVRFRLDMYTGLVILLIFILSLSLISRILHQKPHELFESTVVVQTLFFVVIFAVSMAGIVFTAHLANKKMQYHRYTICGHLTNMQQELQTADSAVDVLPPTGLKNISVSSDDTTRESAQQFKTVVSPPLLAESVRAAHICLESLEVMDTVDPIRIMGIKCEARHAAWIIYALLLFLFVLFQYSFFGRVALS